MDTKLKQALADGIKDFHLPRYAELPDDGLYLKQAETYINRILAPLGMMEITTSMIRNYVKQDIVENPVALSQGSDRLSDLHYRSETRSYPGLYSADAGMAAKHLLQWNGL